MLLLPVVPLEISICRMSLMICACELLVAPSTAPSTARMQSAISWSISRAAASYFHAVRHCWDNNLLEDYEFRKVHKVELNCGFGLCANVATASGAVWHVIWGGTQRPWLSCIQFWFTDHHSAIRGLTALLTRQETGQDACGNDCFDATMCCWGYIWSNEIRQ